MNVNSNRRSKNPVTLKSNWSFSKQTLKTIKQKFWIDSCTEQPYLMNFRCAWSEVCQLQKFSIFGTFFFEALVMAINNSTAILPYMLIQDENLSATGSRMFTKNW